MFYNKKVIAIKHLEFENLGLFEPTLRSLGFWVSYLTAGIDDLSLIEQEKPDIVIVLGGPISVNDSERYPFLLKEVELLRHRVLNKEPTLGICLGAQLIASALGGKISPLDEVEIGWDKLTLSSVGETGVFKSYPEGQPVFHWHGETFELPDGCVLQASTSLCKNQAFSYGNNVLGVQFHPEFVGRDIEKWLVGHTLELKQRHINLDLIRKETHLYAGEAFKFGYHFLTNWLEQLTAQERYR